MARKMSINMKAHDFKFSRKWFLNRNLPTFRDHLFPLLEPKIREQEPITYLELGVFEGMSMVWMLQHVISKCEESRAVGIDPWLMTTKLDNVKMENVRASAAYNVSPWSPKVKLIRGCSCEVLRRMCGRGGYEGIGKRTVDVSMIDGNHFDYAVIDDVRHVIPLVKKGGIILFDDVENDKPKANHVKQGIQAWLELDKPPVKQIFKHRYVEAYQVTE